MGLVFGILLVVVGGAMEGLFSLGITRTPKWAWENTWGLGSLIALVVVPWPLVLMTVPNVGSLFSEVGTTKILITLLLGIGWGLGGIFWGKAIAAVGVALGVSLLMGFINVFGGPAPLWIFHPEKALTPTAIMLYVAVGVMLLGIVFISMAGQRKETDMVSKKETDTAEGKKSTPFIVGLMFCLISGAMSASVNFGLIYGNEVGKMGDLAAKHGAPAWATSFVVWALVFTGNFGVNFLYAFGVMIKNKNVMRIFETGGSSHWFWAAFLGLCWPLGIIVFGIGAGYMGTLGAYAGFPMMLLCAVLVGNLAGAMQGEWKGASGRAKNMMMVGVATLLVAFGILGYSNTLPADASDKAVTATNTQQSDPGIATARSH